ncbi:MAG: recombinase family protein [Pirellulales bacterium]
MIQTVADGRLVGYARVSTDDQNLTLQIDALRNHGVDETLIFTDKISGAKCERPGLDQCLASLECGDTLLAWRLDRLGRSMHHLVNLIEELREREIGFRSVSDGAIDTTSASGELIFNIFSALAQLELRLIQERTRAGIAATRARGRIGGRPKIKLDRGKVHAVWKLHEDGVMSIDDICKMLRISRSTFYRYVRVKIEK